MKQLDAVYNTFTKLETNFSRSKKSRVDYLTDKLGGDIELGMLVILDYFAGVSIESDEDIRKLSVVKDIFAGIKRNLGNLDTIDSFDQLTSTDQQESILVLLDESMLTGSRIRVSRSEQLEFATHYIATADELRMVPILNASRIKVFNSAMRALTQSLVGTRHHVEIGQVYSQGMMGSLELVK